MMYAFSCLIVMNLISFGKCWICNATRPDLTWLLLHNVIKQTVTSSAYCYKNKINVTSISKMLNKKVTSNVLLFCITRFCPHNL